MRRLILHIGTQKTGTKSLQRFLWRNHERLRNFDILYPLPTVKPAVGHRNLGRQLLKDWRFDRTCLTFDKLAAELAGAPEQIVILSSESFSFLSSDASAIRSLYDFWRRLGFAISVVAFVRPQHTHINSLYAQRTKDLENGLRFEPFIEDQLTRDTLQVRWTKYLPSWDLGPGMSLIPVPFGRTVLQPNLETAFFDAVGLADRIAPLLDGARRAHLNRSPGPMTVELCRRMTDFACRKLGEEEWRVHDRRVELGRFIGRLTDERSWNTTPFMGLDRLLCDRIRAAFARDNARFAQRFWDMDWDAAFESESVSDPESNEFRREGASEHDERSIREVFAEATEGTGINGLFEEIELVRQGERRDQAAGT